MPRNLVVRNMLNSLFAILTQYRQCQYFLCHINFMENSIQFVRPDNPKITQNLPAHLTVSKKVLVALKADTPRLNASCTNIMPQNSHSNQDIIIYSFFPSLAPNKEIDALSIGCCQYLLYNKVFGM